MMSMDVVPALLGFHGSAGRERRSLAVRGATHAEPTVAIGKRSTC